MCDCATKRIIMYYTLEVRRTLLPWPNALFPESFPVRQVFCFANSLKCSERARHHDR